MAHQLRLIFGRPTMAEAALYARRPSDDGAMIRIPIVAAETEQKFPNQSQLKNFEQKVSNINASIQ